MMFEIINNHEEYLKFIRQIEKAKQIIYSTENNQLKSKAHLLNDIKDYNSFYSKENYETLKHQFTCEERTELKLYKLDNYSIFLSSKWFTEIDDFINLEMSCKQCNGNLDKFYFNPMPLTQETREM